MLFHPCVLMFNFEVYQAFGYYFQHLFEIYLQYENCFGNNTLYKQSSVCMEFSGPQQLLASQTVHVPEKCFLTTCNMQHDCTEATCEKMLNNLQASVDCALSTSDDCERKLYWSTMGNNTQYIVCPDCALHCVALHKLANACHCVF